MKQLLPRKVLVFDSYKRFVAFCPSVKVASRFTGCAAGNITRACNGYSIAAGKMYFRYIPNDLILDSVNVCTLRLQDFDKLCGVERYIYPNHRMNRENWKYNKG